MSSFQKLASKSDGFLLVIDKNMRSKIKVNGKITSGISPSINTYKLYPQISKFYKKTCFKSSSLKPNPLTKFELLSSNELTKLEFILLNKPYYSSVQRSF